MRIRDLRLPHDVQLQPQRPMAQRRMRTPNHQFFLNVRPFQLVPTFVAPVLPGETLKNGLVQARCISDPINNRVSGWWLEHFVFYVRAGDFLDGDDEKFRQMLIGNQGSAYAIAGSVAWGGTVDASAVDYYHTGAGYPSWVKRALQPIVRAYFRDEGDEPSAYTIDTYYAASLAGATPYDSLTAASVIGSVTGADDWAKAWTAYQAMRRSQTTQNQTFEEYLAQHGVSTPPRLREAVAGQDNVTTQDVRDVRIPELLRYVREFAYPVPTVDMSTGLIRSTVQWTIVDRMDRRRFFAEPGFLVGLMLVRPKTFLKNQPGVLADYLTTTESWLPAEYDTDPHTSIWFLNHLATTPLITGQTADGYMDFKALFLKGDQFTNHGDTTYNIDGAHAPNLVSLPTVDATNVRYPTLADAQSFFVQTAAVAPATGPAQFVTIDGVASLKIASRLQETTAHRAGGV